MKLSNDWRTSSYSTGTEPNCVQCRAEDKRVQVRDSQHPDAATLEFSTSEWHAFLAEL